VVDSSMSILQIRGREGRFRAEEHFSIISFFL
jgi:hypothetical protein